MPSLYKASFIITSFLLVACISTKESSPPTSPNKSHYHIHRFKKIQESDRTVIKIAAFDLDDHRIAAYNIVVNDRHIYRNKANEPIIMKLKPGNYFFKFKNLGYDSLTTHTFFIGTDDSLHINLYLEKSISLHN